MLNLSHQNWLCIGTKPAFSFWINISTISAVRCDCQGLGLVARIEASILVFDTKQVLYWPILGQIQFCSFDRRYKTCLDTKPVSYQGRFCSLTDVMQREVLILCVILVDSSCLLKLGQNGSPLVNNLEYRFPITWYSRLSTYGITLFISLDNSANHDRITVQKHTVL